MNQNSNCRAHILLKMELLQAFLLADKNNADFIDFSHSFQVYAHDLSACNICISLCACVFVCVTLIVGLKAKAGSFD